jgi:hypothetical protein
VDLAGALHVRPPAQVLEGVVPVGGENRALAGRERVAVFVGAALQDVLDELQLVGLILEQRAGLLRGDLPADEGVVPGDDLPHPRLDPLQVLRRQGAGQIEIVVEAVLDGRPDPQLALGEHLQDRLGHDVGAGVADPIQPCVLIGHDLLLRHPVLLSSPPGAARRAEGLETKRASRPIGTRGAGLPRFHPISAAPPARPPSGPVNGGQPSAPTPAAPDRGGPSGVVSSRPPRRALSAGGARALA